MSRRRDTALGNVPRNDVLTTNSNPTKRRRSSTLLVNESLTAVFIRPHDRDTMWIEVNQDQEQQIGVNGMYRAEKLSCRQIRKPLSLTY